MRRAYLLLLPALLVLAGFDRAPEKSNTLTVNSVSCQAFTTWRFTCVADVSGGSGVYNSYSWSWPHTYGGGPGSAWTYVNEVDGMCGQDGIMTITVTVTDSNWNTAQGYGGVSCYY